MDQARVVDEAQAGGGGARLGQRELDDELGAVGRVQVVAEQDRPAGRVGRDALAAQQRRADGHVQQLGVGGLGGVGADRLRRPAQRDAEQLVERPPLDVLARQRRARARPGTTP